MKSLSVGATISLFALALVAGCGVENSLVGGRCRAGLVYEDGACVPADEAPPMVVDLTPLPDGGWPVPVTDAGLGDADVDATLPTDAGRDATLVLDPVQPERPLLDSGLEPTCTPPLVLCGGKCIPVDSDPQNCGACGKICPSNICIAGECQGATPGDVVLVGHDYTNAAAGSAQAKVLVNTMSIPTTDPIRVLSFEDGAEAAAVAQLKALATGGIKRKITYTRAASASALTSSTLSRFYDVVIIHDASAVNPATVGPTWNVPLNTFAMKGGVVLAVDTGDSPMPELMTSSGLLTVGGHTKLPDNAHLLVTAASDVVGAGVLSPYAAFGPPVSFQGVTVPGLDLTWVVRKKELDGSPGDPVVVHRSVR